MIHHKEIKLYDSRSRVNKKTKTNKLGTTVMSKLHPPEQLSFHDTATLAERWRMWAQEMRLYLNLSMKKDDDKDKCSAFLYIIGRTGREIYNTWSLTEEEQNNLEILFERFAKYCKPKQNITLDRYKFNCRVQLENESLDEFFTDLKKMAKNCQYGTLEEEMIRDRIVVGIQNQIVKERLLREPDLTLDQAITICRADEQSKKGISLMTAESETVHLIKKNMNFRAKKGESSMPKGHKTHRQRFNRSTQVKQAPASQFNCFRCGYTHEPKACPAFGKTCQTCKKQNHFAKMCKSKTADKRVFEINENSSNPDIDLDEEHYPANETKTKFFIGTVNSVNEIKKDNDWSTVLNCRGQNLTVKLDTGAQSNVMSQAIAKKLNVLIKPTKAKLTAYSGDSIDVIGETIIPCFHKEQKYDLQFIIAASSQAQTILGLKSCEDMNLIQRMCMVDKEQDDLSNLIEEFSDTFGELGCVNYKYHMKIDESIAPTVASARRIPISSRKKIQQELERMERLEVIQKVDEPTEWVNPMIVVEKPNGDLRICMDPQQLNQAILREHYQLPTLEEITLEMKGAKYFTKLDASSGFWQIPLDEYSSRLCTFATPFGRYRFLRLPFGIKSAPEVFQKIIHRYFGNIEGVVSYEDDLCIWSTSKEEHLKRLKEVFRRARECGLKFNKSKCELAKTEMRYLGHILSEDGIQADPSKILAIKNMPRPENKHDLMRFLGMVTYLTKFIPRMSEKTAPLRQLLEKDAAWIWETRHDEAFQLLKTTLTTSPVLAYFDVDKPVVVSADASKDGLGAVLLQNDKPIAYASRSLTSAERNYAMIEKETLAIVFAMEKFHQYAYGRKVLVETDHQPIVSIHKKAYDKCPARIQRFLLRLQRYDIQMSYKRGKDQVLSDTLSRATLEEEGCSEIPEEEIETFVSSVVANLPALPTKLEELKHKQNLDEDCQLLFRLVKNGWPDHVKQIPKTIRPFYTFREEITEHHGLLLKGKQIIIPFEMRQEMLTRVHEGHLGIEMSKQRARENIFWPGMYKDIEKLISQCGTCLRYRKVQQKEPILCHQVPDRPFQKVAADLFNFGGESYLLVVDYTTKFFEIALLNDTTSPTVISHMKAIFARHGIPLELITDNGPQFVAKPFADFTKHWQITHQTSSPLYPKSNGFVERTVQIVKNLLKKAKNDNADPYLAVLNFRTTDKTYQPSPAKMLMGRKLRTLLPSIPPATVTTQSNIAKQQENQSRYYNQHAKPLAPLQEGEYVRQRNQLTKTWEPAKIVQQCGPRSYEVQTKDGFYRRNRHHLLKTNESNANVQSDNIDGPCTSPSSSHMRTNENVAESLDFPHPHQEVYEHTPDGGDDRSPLEHNTDKHYITRSGRTVRKPTKYTL